MRISPAALVAAAALALAAASAAHGQATIADCEKIQAADAYNQCLAKFGPSGKNLNIEPEKPGDVKASPEDAAATAGKPMGARHGAGRHQRRGAHAVRRGGGGHGRKRVTFTIRRRHK